MFRLFFIIIFLFCYRTWCAGQPNLVPNPGFEEITQCPSDLDQVNLAIPWVKPTSASSDYFNLCGSNIVSPIANCFGFQPPLSGNGFMGLYAFIGTNYREYIQVKLTEVLLPNIEYCIEYYVSLSDSSDYAINNLGCLFTNYPISNPTDPPFLINISPQVVNNASTNPLINKEAWIKIEGSFVALGGEQYLTIGNFFSDSESDTVYIGGSNFSSCGYGASYYYIDDISVKLCNYSLPVIEISNMFSPNNDGVNDSYFIHHSNISSYSMNIFNRWGINIKRLTEQDSIWDGLYNGLPVSEGVYFYTIYYQDLLGETFSTSGIIQLVR